MENYDFKKVIKETRQGPIKEKATWLSTYVHSLDSAKYYMREISSPSMNTVKLKEGEEERKVIMFGSNDYLGLANHPKLLGKVTSKIEKHGIGLGGPPLLNGYTSIHRMLEEKISKLKHTEDAMLFSSGYMANLAVIGSLVNNKRDLLIYDEYCHASLVDGMTLNKVSGISFKHNDWEGAKRILEEKAEKYNNVFIAVEGLYSMDGDTVPLDKFDELANQFNAHIILDDCHGTGVLGEDGSGVQGMYDDLKASYIVVGSFSKAIGMSGGFIAGDHVLVDYIRILSRQFMFSASMPPILVASILSAFEIMEETPELLKKLKENSSLLYNSIKDYVQFASDCKQSIIVVRIPEKVNIISLKEEFDNRGIFLNAVSYPAVPLDQQRFRISCMAIHTLEDINYLSEQIKEIWCKYKIDNQSMGLTLKK